MRNTTSKPYIAGAAAILKRRIVKFDAAENTVTTSAAAADRHVGIIDSIGADPGGRAEVYKSGLVDVEYGGNVTRGDPLTSDAVGRAVTAAPAAGVNVRIIGFAEVSGVLGDVGECDLEPGFMQG